MPLSLMSAPAIAQDPTPPPTTTPTPKTPPSTPTGKALAQAKKDNRRIEIEALHSETTTYYANPDGKTLRMEQYLEPIRVKTADGFTPVDTTLIATDGVIKPKAIKGDLTLSTGGDTAAIKSQDAKDALRVDASTKLPKPNLKDSTATYPAAYGKNIDLVVTATPTGFRQQIVLRERPAGPVTFRIPVDLPDGLSFGKGDKGQPALKNKDGKTFLDIRPAPLLDAIAADPSGDIEAAKVGQAAVTLDGSTLVYTPDQAFLADPATTYPVTMAAVDDDWYECGLDRPSSTHCPDGVSAPYDGEPMDTFVNNADYPDSWSNFNLDRILVGKSNSGSVRWRSYIQFPLPAKSDPFWGSTIQNADLTLWNHLSSGCGAVVGSGVTARRITSDWDELELTWANQPSVTSVGADNEPGGYNSANCTGSMNYEWYLVHSINRIVQDWADGAPNYGIQLAAGNESDTTNWRRYRTRESTYPAPAHAPRLSVDFEPAAPPVVDGFTFTSPDPITSLPTYEEARARSIYEPTGNEQTTISNEFSGRIAGQRDGEAFEVGADELDLPAEGSDGDDGSGEDTLAPQVIAVEPANGAVDVPLDAKLKVTFSEPADEAAVVLKDADGAEVTATMAYDSTNTTVTVTPAQALTPETTYTAVISDATDPWENVMDPYSWSFTTGGPDTTAPTVTATEPGAEAADVSVTTTVSATFAEAVSEAEITLKDPAGAEIPGASAMDGTATILTFTPAQTLIPNTRYTAEVSGAKDTAGNVMAAPHVWSFTTAPPDTTAPTVTETVPGRDASGVAVTTTVQVTFSEPVSAAQILVKNPANASIAGNVAMDAANRVLTFTPAQSLAPATKYTVTVSGAEDAAGNTMTAYDWSFTTSNPGLVAAYGMDEGSGTTVGDASGRNNTGTTSNTNWVTGKYGKALSFNGTSSRVTIGHSNSLRLTTGMTLSAWVRPSTVTGWRTVMMKDHLSFGDASYSLYASDGDGRPSSWFFTSAQGSGGQVSGSTPLPINTWSHVAVSYDGSTARLYVNGTQTGQRTLSGSLQDDGGALRIGGNGIYGEYFSGLIDEVRIYNRAQTASQLQADMNTAISTPGPPDTQAPTAPGSVTATGGQGSAQLSWTASTDNVGVTDYTVHRSTSAGFTPSSANQVGSVSNTSFTDSGLGAGTYYYRVLALDAAGNVSTSSGEATATVFPAPANPGLIAAYGMEEGSGTRVGDASGQNNTGTASNTSWVTGKYGKALSFNGTSSWVTVNHSASLRLTTGMTLSAWVRPTTVADWRTVVMKDNFETDGMSYSLYASNGVVPSGWLQADSDIAIVDGTTPLPTNAWRHVAVTYNGNTARLYVDGNQVNQTSLSGSLVDDGSDLHIGGNSLWGEHFSGIIDEVRIYNIAQTAAQIQTDMNTQIGAAPAQTQTQALAESRSGTGASDSTSLITKLAVLGSTVVDGKTTTSTRTPQLAVRVSSPHSRQAPGTVEVEVAEQPTKSSKNRRLIWSGRTTGKDQGFRKTLRIPSGKLKNGAQVRWRARLTGADTSNAWSNWQDLRIDASTPTSSPAATSASQSAATSNFDYKHPSLEDCYDTTAAPRFTDAYSRMQERPHSACWTTWIGHGGWEEYDDNGVKKRRNKTAWWVRLFPGPLRIPAAVLDKVTDDDVFTFRATWVAHTYIGDSTGNAIYKGGTTTADLKPQNIKFFVKLTDFGVWNRGVRRTELDDDLDDVRIEFDLDTQGCQIQKGNPTQLKTIASWRATSYLEYLINTSKPTAHDREVCSIMPAITQYKESKGRLPLWDQELLGSAGKRLGVVRWGQGTPSNNLWSPSFRCDWKKLGVGKKGGGNTGGCIYIRADRVFTMSKSRDSEFLDVILHIEKALNPATNAGTYPPYRSGDTTAGRDINLPPVKGPLGNELPKVIPGNYAKPPNIPEGAPLWRGIDTGYEDNRKIFSQHAFEVPQDNFRLGNYYSSNYCKYYTSDVYIKYGYTEVQCDEYPFASTQEGAAKDKINYSVQGVRAGHNWKHGDALKVFYGHYRLLTYDPVNTITKVSDSPFWVKIVD